MVVTVLTKNGKESTRHIDAADIETCEFVVVDGQPLTKIKLRGRRRRAIFVKEQTAIVLKAKLQADALIN
tara:strand:+ start:1521 stop:1730 length:210 start_codon:yes stop_codon:yes gene_type:complete